MDFYYHGAWRMDWGLGNPNKTAVLIACLTVAAWGAAYRFRSGFWWALGASIVLAWCLVQTYSRGGMTALLAGLAVLLAFAPRPWPRARWVGAMAALWIIGLFILGGGAGERYGQGLFGDDPSVQNRISIWKYFPEMLAAAPWGWGWGRAGDSYTQWFQPPGQALNYLNLISSHFTWMAEGGWFFSAFYLFAWVVVYLICWPMREWRCGPVPLAGWTALAVGACFSHVEDSPWLWIVPLALLGHAAWSRARLKQWPASSALVLGAALSISIVALVVLAGIHAARLPIIAARGGVVMGRGPHLRAIIVDRGVMGKLFGHTLRKYLLEHRDELSDTTFFVTECPDDAMPAQASQAVISGRMLKDPAVVASLQHSGQIILVNPVCFPEETAWDASLAARTEVYFGEYSQEPSRSSWSSCPNIKMRIIDGAGDFVPEWPQAIWAASDL